MAESKNFVISGTAYWAHVRTPNKLSNKYQIDVSIDKKTAKMLQEMGVTIKNKKDDRDNFVTLKRNSETKDGQEMAPPKIVDSQKNEIPNDVLIGNGSKVNVSTSLYHWTMKGKAGISLNLNKIQVIDLVEYNNDGFEAVTGGYTTSQETVAENKETGDPEDEGQSPF